MNNKQLFEQSARKILSANQLEGVMRLHTALFECGDPEQTAETVADAVKDAVDDVVDTAADQQVSEDIENAPSVTISPEDKERLTALFSDMSDDDKAIFVESLDDTQAQILTEGLGAWAGKWGKSLLKLLTKEGRKAHRLDKFGRLASKDADMTSRLDRIMNLDPASLSKRNAKDASKLFKQRDKVERKMNNLMYTASKDAKEYEKMQKLGLKKGSRNFNVDVFQKEKDTLMEPLNRDLKAAKAKLKQDQQALNPKDPDYLSKFRQARIDYENTCENLTKAFEAKNGKKLNDLNYKIRMAKEEGRYGAYGPAATNSATVNNGAATAGRNGRNNPFNQRTAKPENAGAAPQNPFPGGIDPRMFTNPSMWKMFTRRFSTMGKISTALIGAWHAVKLAFAGGVIGALTYGGYKLYDFFTRPNEIDIDWADGGDTKSTLLKALAVLAGGAGGNIAARLLGFNGTAGKTVGTLAGALLVAYFMFLNGGDEDNAKEMLQEYSNASDEDRELINEALEIPEYAEALKKMYLENAEQ
jgi:hypothetical protein